jgi:hypothetical protein
MYLKESIAKSIVEYPSLYKDINYLRSEQKVLDHLFLVIGNGYSWWDGYLVNTLNGDVKSRWCDKVNDYVVDKGPKYGKNRFDSTQLTLEFFSKTKARLIAPGMYLPEENRSDWEPYPISEHSGLAVIPDNVQLDWLAGAAKTLVRVIEFYEEHPNWDERYNDWQKKSVREGLAVATRKIDALLLKHNLQSSEFDKIIDSPLKV